MINSRFKDAEIEIRTRYLVLTKDALYQLSYDSKNINPYNRKLMKKNKKKSLFFYFFKKTDTINSN